LVLYVRHLFAKYPPDQKFLPKQQENRGEQIANLLSVKEVPGTPQ
jgi:hypothetical protein